MVRHVNDPWRKKSSKGMKSIGKMVKVGGKVGGALGAAAYNEIKKTKTKTKSRNTDSISIPPIGCLTFILGAIIGAVVMGSSENFLPGFFYFIGILFLTIIATVIVSILFSNNSNDDVDKSSVPSSALVMSQPIQSSIEEGNLERIKDLIINMRPFQEIELFSQQYQDSGKKRKALKQALDKALLEINSKDEIADETEKYIDSFMEKYGLKDDETTHSESYIEFTKSLIVQDMLKGITSKRVTLEASPINMQPDEVPLWPFMNVVYYEEVTHRSMVGASTGLSVRIAKGIYYKVGAFKGEPVLTSGLQAKYSGALILTNKNVYFYSTAKSMKFPYNKIIAFIPFEDGIGIQPNKTNAKTVYFKGLDGRFAFNIVSNINNLG